jgi:hypothetical protein
MGEVVDLFATLLFLYLFENERFSATIELKPVRRGVAQI